MQRISVEQLRETISSFQLQTKRWVPVAASLGTYSLAEVLGSLTGIPTFAGRVHEALGIVGAGDFPGIKFVLMILPQGLAIALATMAILRTPWPLWLAARIKGRGDHTRLELEIPTISLATGISVLVWAAGAWEWGAVPLYPNWLIRGQIVLISIAVLPALLSFWFGARTQYEIDSLPGRYQFLASTTLPIELEFSPQLPSLVVLRQVSDGYALVQSRSIALGDGGLRIWDLQALKSDVEVIDLRTDSDFLTCSCRIRLLVGVPADAGTRPVLNRAVVDRFFENFLFGPERLVPVLSEVVSHLLKLYEGDNISVRKRFSVFEQRRGELGSEHLKRRDKNASVIMPGSQSGVLRDASSYADFIGALNKELHSIRESWDAIALKRTTTIPHLFKTFQGALEEHVVRRLDIVSQPELSALRVLLTYVSFSLREDRFSIGLSNESVELSKRISEQQALIDSDLSDQRKRIDDADIETDKTRAYAEKRLIDTSSPRTLGNAATFGLESNPAFQSLKDNERRGRLNGGEQRGVWGHRERTSLTDGDQRKDSRPPDDITAEEERET